VTQADKLLIAMRANRRGWTMADIERLCRAHGLEVLAPTRGSHFKIGHRSVARVLVVPYNRPIKPVYVTAVIELIDLLESRR
jgi:hypothetical protein